MTRDDGLSDVGLDNSWRSFDSLADYRDRKTAEKVIEVSQDNSELL
jgi:hypothetical protein